MKRTLLAGTFYALAGVATLLLVASIFYSCRSGGDPHHSGSAALQEAPPDEPVHSTQASRTATDGTRIAVVPDRSSRRGS